MPRLNPRTTPRHQLRAEKARRNHQAGLAAFREVTMDAFEHFQITTTLIADGQRPKARREIIAAIDWIDRTGRDRHVRAPLAELLASLDLWQNSDGTWSHHRDAQRRWQSRGDAATDLRFHREWSKSK